MKNALRIFAVLTCSCSLLYGGEKKSETNVAYADHQKQKLDIYWNADFKNAPIVVNIHGGGWRNGDKSGFGNAAYQQLIVDDLKCVLVSPNYRLIADFFERGKAPSRGEVDGKVDGMMSDVASAVAFVQRNAEKYGADPKRVIVCGSSAGGHLSAALAYCDGTDWLEGTAYAGDELNIVGWFGDSAPLSKTHNAQIPFGPKAIPDQNVDANDPPGFMVVGTRDRLVPAVNSNEFAALLKAQKIWHQVFTVEGGGHVVGKQVTKEPEMKSAFSAFLKFAIGEAEAPNKGAE